MGCLTFPPTKSPRLPQNSSIASQGAWHGSAKEPPARLPPRQPFSQLCQQKRPQNNEELIAALHPCDIPLYFFYEASSKRTTNILLERCVLPAVYPSRASGCNPRVQPWLQSRALQMLRAVFLPRKPPRMQCSRTKLSEKDQGSSQKFAVPSLGLEPPFSCFGDKFQSMPAKERHCFAPRHYGGERSTQCHDLAVTFLSLLSCNGVGEKKHLLRIFSSSCLTTHSCCSAAQQICSTFCCSEKMLVFSCLILCGHKNLTQLLQSLKTLSLAPAALV